MLNIFCHCKDSLLHMWNDTFLLLQIGNLFGSRRSTIVTLYNGAFDSSSALLLIIKVRSILPPWAISAAQPRYSRSVPPFASPSSCYTSLASAFALPSSSSPPAASFTCSGLSSCCPRSSSPIRCPITTHTGMTSNKRHANLQGVNVTLFLNLSC